jgi:hypothetical protein
LDLPSLYWIHKLHKCPFKQRYTGITGSVKCSTKSLSKLLTCILLAVNVLQIRVRNSRVKGREVKRFHAIAGGDEFLYVCMYSNRSLEFFRIHI